MRVICITVAACISAASALFAQTHGTVADAIASLESVREPLKYRIVSFHRGRANKDTIRRAHELGFNGVQFQLEGSTVESLNEFAERDRREQYIKFCHDLGMQVTLWVHELSDIPTDTDDPGYLGPVSLDNDKLWSHLEQRYEWLLGELLPDIDGIALTVVETQINASDTPLMLKLVGILRDKCAKYGKMLIVRTFTWHPEELEGVMGCIRRLPEETIIMSKCVPQDWQMRGIHNKAIGAVGDHEQIIEYDVAGEYFLLDHVANCMPALLKEQFDYQMTKGIDGICVRVDRWDAQVLYEPSEVNLWTLGLLAAGKTDNVDDVWKAWATFRYGPEAAPHVIAALEPTQFVVTECLNVGQFSFGDTRRRFPRAIKDAFHTNWANWRWDADQKPEYELARRGDPEHVAGVIRQKEQAIRLAEQCLDRLETARDLLPPIEYDILRTKLENNRFQLAFRSRMMLTYLAYKRIISTDDNAEKHRLTAEARAHIAQIRELMRRPQPPVRKVDHLGRTWTLDAPTGYDAKAVNEWVDETEYRINVAMQHVPAE